MVQGSQNRTVCLLARTHRGSSGKIFSESEKTIKVHARKMRSGLQLTKKQPLNKGGDDNDDDIGIPTTRHHDIFTRVYCIDNEEELHNIYSDQTGRFPKKSSKGNQYIMVLVHIDSSAILVVAMKDCTSGDMIRVYQYLINRLNSRGICPQHHVLDNKCSAKFKATIKSN